MRTDVVIEVLEVGGLSPQDGLSPADVLEATSPEGHPAAAARPTEVPAIVAGDGGDRETTACGQR